MMSKTIPIFDVFHDVFDESSNCKGLKVLQVDFD